MLFQPADEISLLVIAGGFVLMLVQPARIHCFLLWAAPALLGMGMLLYATKRLRRNASIVYDHAVDIMLVLQHFEHPAGKVSISQDAGGIALIGVNMRNQLILVADEHFFCIVTGGTMLMALRVLRLPTDEDGLRVIAVCRMGVGACPLRDFTGKCLFIAGFRMFMVFSASQDHGVAAIIVDMTRGLILPADKLRLLLIAGACMDMVGLFFLAGQNRPSFIAGRIVDMLKILWQRAYQPAGVVVAVFVMLVNQEVCITTGQSALVVIA